MVMFGGVFREQSDWPTLDGKHFWKQISAPKALKSAARAALVERLRSRFRERSQP